MPENTFPDESESASAAPGVRYAIRLREAPMLRNDDICVQIPSCHQSPWEIGQASGPFRKGVAGSVPKAHAQSDVERTGLRNQRDTGKKRR